MSFSVRRCFLACWCVFLSSFSKSSSLGGSSRLNRMRPSFCMTMSFSPLLRLICFRTDWGMTTCPRSPILVISNSCMGITFSYKYDFHIYIVFGFLLFFSVLFFGSGVDVGFFCGWVLGWGL